VAIRLNDAELMNLDLTIRPAPPSFQIKIQQTKKTRKKEAIQGSFGSVLHLLSTQNVTIHYKPPQSGLFRLFTLTRTLKTHDEFLHQNATDHNQICPGCSLHAKLIVGTTS